MPRSKASTPHRQTDAPDLLVPLDATAARPLYQQVYDALRGAILAGRLPAGARLPSTRALADDLGIARNTVSLAFDQLRAEGYIAGHRGGGTRVRATTPDTLLRVRSGVAAPGAANGPTARGRSTPSPLPSSAPAVPAVPAVRLSVRGAALAAAGRSSVLREASPARPFRLGVPAVDAFPDEVWARLAARRWRRGRVAVGEGRAAGDPALCAAIAEYVTNARGARCTADQVLVVSGAQQAIDLVARVLVDPGDGVWVEEPGYPDARAPLLDAGARLVPVAVDDEGLDVAAGERLAPQARLACVTPSHQYPLGAVMSAPRRLALLAWARRAGAWVVEDDYDSEFRYGSRPLPCLQGLDAEAHDDAGRSRVLYAGTFSKTLAPGLRLGYLLLPETLVDDFRAARAVLDRFAPTVEQGVLADFIGEGHYVRHVRRVRALYAERQEALVEAAASELRGLLTLAPSVAGLHLVGTLPPGLCDVAAARAAAAAGVDVVALSSCRLVSPPMPPAGGGLVLGYAGFDPRTIRAGVQVLGRALEGALARALGSGNAPLA